MHKRRVCSTSPPSPLGGSRHGDRAQASHACRHFVPATAKCYVWIEARGDPPRKCACRCKDCGKPDRRSLGQGTSLQRAHDVEGAMDVTRSQSQRPARSREMSRSDYELYETQEYVFLEDIVAMRPKYWYLALVLTAVLRDALPAKLKGEIITDSGAWSRS